MGPVKGIDNSLTGRALELFLTWQIKDNTGSGAPRTKALNRENVKTDINQVPTSVDAYTVGPLKEWFMTGTSLQTCSCRSTNKNRLASMGSNLCDQTKLVVMMMPFNCSYRNKNVPTAIYPSLGYSPPRKEKEAYVMMPPP